MVGAFSMCVWLLAVIQSQPAACSHLAVAQTFPADIPVFNFHILAIALIIIIFISINDDSNNDCPVPGPVCDDPVPIFGGSGLGGFSDTSFDPDIVSGIAGTVVTYMCPSPGSRKVLFACGINGDWIPDFPATLNNSCLN